MSFFNELKRRNVIRVGFAYAVVGWVIAQVADLALESFGAPDWVMKTLLFLMFIGFIVALFVSWAYELTPEGIKRAEDVNRNESITRQTGRKLDRLVIVVLLIAVGVLVAERYVWDEPAVVQAVDHATQDIPLKVDPNPQENSSIAVLPFVNMSSDPEQEFFSDGISEEILNVLTRIPNLKVAARTSSFQFKGKNLDIADVGKQLQVNHILEGSVRKAGNTLRITAQLIEVENGFHLWSQSFDRKLEDVFAIQDEIAAAIAKELRARLTTELEQSSEVIDLDAYELYLKGRSLVARRKHTQLYDGIESLKAALDIEPEYAPALATLAKAYVVLPFFSSQMPVGEARKLARDSAEKALVIDPQNVEALAVLAIIYNEVDYNPQEAVRLLKRALENNPGNVAANNFLGDIYLRVGDLKNAMKYESRAAELDPLGAVQLSDLAGVHLMLGEYDKVLELANRALALDSKFTHAQQHLFDVNFVMGNVEEMARIHEIVSSQSVMAKRQMDRMTVALELGQGNRQQAENLVSQIVLRARTSGTGASIAAFNAVLLGDFDTAAEMLKQAYNNNDGTWMFPVWVRLPEQAPNSEPWQEFWRLPGVAELAEIRRSHGMSPHALQFGEGRK